MVALTNQEASALDAASLNDLYARLGRAADPGQPMVGLGEQNLQKMMSGASAEALLMPGWIQRGLNYFESIWGSISSTVCAIYRDYTEIDKDWIEKVAQAIIGLLNIGWAVAVVVVEIIIKRGLAVLCPT